MKWTPEAIRRLRFELGDLTQKAFAKKISKRTSDVTISKWETGDKKPSSMAQARLDELENHNAKTPK